MQVSRIYGVLSVVSLAVALMATIVPGPALADDEGRLVPRSTGTTAEAHPQKAKGPLAQPRGNGCAELRKDPARFAVDGAAVATCVEFTSQPANSRQAPLDSVCSAYPPGVWWLERFNTCGTWNGTLNVYEVP